MKSALFNYELPESAIAQAPSKRRDLCRLASVDRQSGAVRHGRFRDLLTELRRDDLLVLNDSRVLPVRIPCLRDSGGAVEVFVLDPRAEGPRHEAMLKAGGRLRSGESVKPLRHPKLGGFTLLERSPAGNWFVQWQGSGPLHARLDKLGLPPLPPYIRRDRLPDAGLSAKDRRWYQTVFAAQAGSVAAPTAGLHFTTGMLTQLRAQGVRIAHVTLHVGAGTFLPVKTEDLDQHPMHAETCLLPTATATAIASAKRKGGRVVAVGTTALRTLEGAWTPQGFRQGWFETRLFLKPGDRFNVVDALLTNFHQPHSTLLPLVAAFWDREKILQLYADCLKKGYRFLSYGDACFLY